jgi:hypothetical protein
VNLQAELREWRAFRSYPYVNIEHKNGDGGKEHMGILLYRGRIRKWESSARARSGDLRSGGRSPWIHDACVSVYKWRLHKVGRAKKERAEGCGCLSAG